MVVLIKFKARVVVLMSVYKKDTLNWVEESVSSLLNQSFDDFLLLIALDGPQNVAVSSYLEFISNHRHNVHLLSFCSNRGLASCLNDLIDYALANYDCEYFARMDADDISMPDRFKRQVEFLDVNNVVSVLGTELIEFSESGQESRKRMYENHFDIYSNSSIKCPVNHPTVMIRRSVFEDGFRYKSELMNTQDYELWISLLEAGYIFHNLLEPQLRFRINDNFYKRRGLAKAVNEFRFKIDAIARLKVPVFKSLFAALMLLLLRLSPTRVKKYCYSRFRDTVNT